MWSSDSRLKSPSKQFLTFQKSASIWVHLTEWILFLEPTLWGQRLVTAKNKARNIQSFRFKPGIILSGVAKLGDEIREDTGRSRLRQSHKNCSFIRLNDAFRKTLLKAAAKKTLRQRTMRAEFSLIPALISNWHRERIIGSNMKNLFGEEGVIG